MEVLTAKGGGCLLELFAQVMQQDRSW